MLELKGEYSSGTCTRSCSGHSQHSPPMSRWAVNKRTLTLTLVYSANHHPPPIADRMPLNRALLVTSPSFRWTSSRSDG